MKLLLALFLFSTALSAQYIDMPESDVKQKLCKRWKYDFNSDHGTIKRNEAHLRTYALTFMLDYTFTVSIQGTSTTGSWCYNRDKKNIELTIRGENTIRIFMLTDSELYQALASDIQFQAPKKPTVWTHLSPG